MNQDYNQPGGAAPQTTTEGDPIGPIEMPKRSRVGIRAFALIGSASVLAVNVIDATAGIETPFTTVSK